MSKNGRQKVFVRLRSHTTDEWFVHPDLRARLVADAEETGSNMTEVAAKILADRYRVPYEPNGRHTQPRPDDDKLNISLPERLLVAIRTAAASRGLKYQDAIRADLCAHYGLDMPARVAA